MSKILVVTSTTVTIGLDDKSLKEFDIHCCRGFTPEVGTEVNVSYENGRAVITKVSGFNGLLSVKGSSITVDNSHSVNKVAYCILCFFLGGLGIHKFYAKHFFLGLLYLLFSWSGIPSLVALIEFFIALTRVPDANGNISA